MHFNLYTMFTLAACCIMVVDYDTKKREFSNNSFLVTYFSLACDWTTTKIWRKRFPLLPLLDSHHPSPRCSNGMLLLEIIMAINAETEDKE